MSPHSRAIVVMYKGVLIRLRPPFSSSRVEFSSFLFVCKPMPTNTMMVFVVIVLWKNQWHFPPCGSGRLVVRLFAVPIVTFSFVFAIRFRGSWSSSRHVIPRDTLSMGLVQKWWVVARHTCPRRRCPLSKTFSIYG